MNPSLIGRRYGDLTPDQRASLPVGSKVHLPRSNGMATCPAPGWWNVVHGSTVELYTDLGIPKEATVVQVGEVPSDLEVEVSAMLDREGVSGSDRPLLLRLASFLDDTRSAREGYGPLREGLCRVLTPTDANRNDADLVKEVERNAAFTHDADNVAVASRSHDLLDQAQVRPGPLDQRIAQFLHATYRARTSYWPLRADKSDGALSDGEIVEALGRKKAPLSPLVILFEAYAKRVEDPELLALVTLLRASVS